MRKLAFMTLFIFVWIILVGLPYVVAGEEALFLNIASSDEVQGTAVSRAKRVEINWGVLENSRTGRIKIDLFDGDAISAIHDHTYPSTATNGYVWIGHVPGHDVSYVTLSVVDDTLVGSIIQEGIEKYTIGYNGQWHVLREMDPSEIAYIPGHDTEIVTTFPEQSIANSTDYCDDGSLIDLLVAYSPDARDLEGGANTIIALINQRVAYMNRANANSGLAFRYRLVHVMETNYVESGDIKTDLYRLRNDSDGYLDDVLVARDQYLTDLTSLFIAQGNGACGWAFVMVDPSTAFADSAVNVNALETYGKRCNRLVMAHEFGHNMGNNHTRGYLDYEPIFPYSFAYESPAGTFRTIMSYGSRMVEHWSNPDIYYAGEPTGVDHEIDPNNSADNARSMEQTSLYVANFRQNCNGVPSPTPSLEAPSSPTPSITPSNTPTPTNTPGSGSVPAPILFDIENSDGDGNYSINWSLVPGIDDYRLRENVKDSGSWKQVYVGPSTRFDRSNMPEGQHCYRIRARIGATLSPWSVDKCTDVFGSETTPTSTATSSPGELASPVVFDIENDDKDGNFAVIWSIVTDAEWYRVKQKFNDRNWVKIYEGSSSKINREVLPDGRYCFRVQAHNTNTQSEWSADKCTVVDSSYASATPTQTSTPSEPILTPSVTPGTGTEIPLPTHHIVLPIVLGDGVENH